MLLLAWIKELGLRTVPAYLWAPGALGLGSIRGDRGFGLGLPFLLPPGKGSPVSILLYIAAGSAWPLWQPRVELTLSPHSSH